MKVERSNTMSNKKNLALFPILLLGVILTGCAAEEPVEIIPVTVVPPVHYQPTQPPITLPTAMPTSAPYATATPNNIQDQQQEPEVRAEDSAPKKASTGAMKSKYEEGREPEGGTSKGEGTKGKGRKATPTKGSGSGGGGGKAPVSEPSKGSTKAGVSGGSLGGPWKTTSRFRTG